MQATSSINFDCFDYGHIILQDNPPFRDKSYDCYPTLQHICHYYQINLAHLCEYIRLAQLSLIKPVEKLYMLLEARVDTLLVHSGMAHAFVQARDLIKLGHVLINNNLATSELSMLYPGDVLSIKQRFSRNAYYRLNNRIVSDLLPSHLHVDRSLYQLHMLSLPTLKHCSSGIHWQNLQSAMALKKG